MIALSTPTPARAERMCSTVDIRTPFLINAVDIDVSPTLKGFASIATAGETSTL